ncbi:MAG: tetratricopeptide repeat protein [Coriobacteriia bacterium]|nr:tetratricopeptide repeat protein [Coriobacteriia bacterium]
MTQQILAAKEFELFRDWIQQQSGVFFEASKTDFLQTALHSRAVSLGLSTFAEYFEALGSEEDEFKELMNLLTINETSFYRFPGQFDALRYHAAPRILRERQDNTSPFRVWSAGCSTGEEPYTIAMTLFDSLVGLQGVPIEVLGTDISSVVLDFARVARYSKRAIRDLQSDVVARWFEPNGDYWRPVKQVRDVCNFRYHNLAQQQQTHLQPMGWDVIFCRNVMIYFEPTIAKSTIACLYDALNPGGYLFLGHSEMLPLAKDCFETAEVNGVFFYRKPSRPSQARQTAFLMPQAKGGAESGPSNGFEGKGIPVRAFPRGVAGAAEAARAHEDVDEVRKTEPVTQDAAALDEIQLALVSAYKRADVGDVAGAIAETDAILEEQPLCAQARYLLGMLKRGQGELGAAAREFRRTLYSDPDFSLAHFALAGIARQNGDAEEAICEYERTLRTLGKERQGTWSVFLGDFSPEMIAEASERGIEESRRAIADAG